MFCVFLFDVATCFWWNLMFVSLALFLYVPASTRHVRIYMFRVYLWWLLKKTKERETNRNKEDEHVHAVDVFQFCMLHTAVRVEWVGNLHPNVFVWPALSHFVCPALKVGAWWGKDVFHNVSMLFPFNEVEVMTSLECVWCEMYEWKGRKHSKRSMDLCSVWKLNLEPQFADGQKEWSVTSEDAVSCHSCDLMFFSLWAVLVLCLSFYFVWRPTLRG